MPTSRPRPRPQDWAEVTSYVAGPVRVSVPATSANLGPGFDALGLALSLRDHLEAEVVGHGLDVSVTGVGEGEVPLGEEHLVIRSMRSVFERLGLPQPGLRLRCRNVIAHARGMGSSSAAIIGGMWLARELVSGGRLLLSDDTLLDLATEIEGHPDNVAAALHGGLVISGYDADGSCYAVRSPVDPRIGAVVFVPPEPVSTHAARDLLPAQVPHADAAANAGRAALLVAAMAGQPEHLLRATRDLLHQDHRRPAMPESLALVDRLRADGLPAFISGAGPSVLVLTDDTAALSARCPTGWESLPLTVDSHGPLPW